jgi:hypothetical protein
MLAGSILAIGESLNSFPAEKSISFSTSMNSLKDTLQEIKTTTEADIQPTLKLVQAVKEYTVVKEKTSEDDPLVRLLREIKGVLEKTGGAAGGKSSIEIKLDKGLLAKEIKENAPNPMSQKGAAMLSYGGT